jgi:hypothetical protein
MMRWFCLIPRIRPDRIFGKHNGYRDLFNAVQQVIVFCRFLPRRDAR